MRLRMNGQLTIDNLRGYPAPVLAALRRLLRAGVAASPDPKRPGFYELAEGNHAFYVHISERDTGAKKLLLLAHWNPMRVAS